ncbi:hypothetical protein GCM10011349_23980 [Novosphingobium indicum]|uniref:Uncharacterized protein n=2 Tax=Novosphingobium indicum TaxID=462949 RepID=A0ABQ2JR69_9SPHN|nr:hypothetical protein GCM10011349_23980 [Novosphingobium indicum]
MPHVQFVLTADDLASFSQATRNEILQRVADVMGSLPPSEVMPAPTLREYFEDIYVADLEDITRKHIGKWMQGLSQSVQDGVRLIAEHGPVIEARHLLDAGISIRHFQSATTRRTRSLTGDNKAFFLAWNVWNGNDDPNGKYAVSPITHQSLRAYFKLPV